MKKLQLKNNDNGRTTYAIEMAALNYNKKNVEGMPAVVLHIKINLKRCFLGFICIPSPLPPSTNSSPFLNTLYLSKRRRGGGGGEERKRRGRSGFIEDFAMGMLGDRGWKRGGGGWSGRGGDVVEEGG